MKYVKLYEDQVPRIREKVKRDDQGNIKSREWVMWGGVHNREDGPARIMYYSDGKVKSEEWMKLGKLHRTEGPAETDYYPDGSIEQETWWINQEQHRVDGPSRIGYDPSGNVIDRLWCLRNVYGCFEFEEEFWQVTPASQETFNKMIRDDSVSDEIKKAIYRNPNYSAPDDLLSDWF